VYIEIRGADSRKWRDNKVLWSMKYQFEHWDWQFLRGGAGKKSYIHHGEVKNSKILVTSQVCLHRLQVALI